MDKSIEQINLLKETAERAGLQISFEKREFVTNIKNTPKFLKYEIRKNQILVNKSKYLGDVIQPNGLHKEANKTRS